MSQEAGDWNSIIVQCIDPSSPAAFVPRSLISDSSFARGKGREVVVVAVDARRLVDWAAASAGPRPAPGSGQVSAGAASPALCLPRPRRRSVPPGRRLDRAIHLALEELLADDAPRVPGRLTLLPRVRANTLNAGAGERRTRVSASPHVADAARISTPARREAGTCRDRRRPLHTGSVTWHPYLPSILFDEPALQEVHVTNADGSGRELGLRAASTRLPASLLSD
jgi:hypothetical protein